MRLLKRGMSLLLSAALIGSMLAGCSSSDASSLMVDGREVKVDYVVEIADNKIPLDEYRYYFLSLEGGYEDPDNLTSDQLEELKQSVLDNLLYVNAVYQLAEEYDVKLGGEQQLAVQNELNSVEEQFGGRSSYLSALASSNLTEDLYRSLTELQYLQQLLYDRLFGEGGEMQVSAEEVKAELEENYVRASHILISNQQGDPEEKKALAEELLERAKSGEDFDALVQEYGEDPGMVDNTDGYYFTTGEMVQEFEDAAFALPVNGISDLVETTYGWHIIKRLPMEDSYIEANLSTFQSQLGSQKFNELIEQTADSLEVSYSEQYDLITTQSLV